MLLVESDECDTYTGTPDYIVAFILTGFNVPRIENVKILYEPHFPNWYEIK